MNTPIYDFVRRYADSGTARLHMPGHKGKAFLGCEALDITEVSGADALYEADGIIAESERNASALFGAQRTLYSAEGSSLSIRAMLHLAVSCRAPGSLPLVLAARNAHKVFLYAAALIGFDVRWLYPERTDSLCSCPIEPDALEAELARLPAPPAAVYVTSPDYLGRMQPIAALAEVCHRYGTRLLVDNAHGAYLHFLERPLHPLDLGADACCDSAHKTLPVLTGGSYLHIGKQAPQSWANNAKSAMALFGSTSPSYLILSSLDLANAQLAGDYPARLADTVCALNALKTQLRASGWCVPDTEPMKLTLDAARVGLSGTALANTLRQNGIECEFADMDSLVLMPSPCNDAAELAKVQSALGCCGHAFLPERTHLPLARGEQVMPIRKAIFAPHISIPVEEALGRICAAPTVSCPPAIPIAVSGERITKEAVAMFRRYGIEQVEVVEE